MDIEAAKLLGAKCGSRSNRFRYRNWEYFCSLYFSRRKKPGAREHVFTMTMLGFALVEALALFALIIALLLLFVF